MRDSEDLTHYNTFQPARLQVERFQLRDALPLASVGDATSLDGAQRGQSPVLQLLKTLAKRK